MRISLLPAALLAVAGIASAEQVDEQVDKSPPQHSDQAATPWGTGQNLPERMAIEQTRVCADDRTHVVVIAPHPEKNLQLFYGDRKAIWRVPLPEGDLAGNEFLDPRFFRKAADADSNGIDMRTYSSIAIDEIQRSCTLRCGSEQHALKWMGPAEVRELLLSVAVVPGPYRHRPYALLRDLRHRYYYVDLRFSPGEEPLFRLFIGPRGALHEQKLTHVSALIPETDGKSLDIPNQDVFSTKGGSLRLVKDDKKKFISATWSRGGKRAVLKVIRVADHLGMIYNELGVYLGQKLGTPCDDF